MILLVRYFSNNFSGYFTLGIERYYVSGSLEIGALFFVRIVVREFIQVLIIVIIATDINDVLVIRIQGTVFSFSHHILVAFL